MQWLYHLRRDSSDPFCVHSGRNVYNGALDLFLNLEWFGDGIDLSRVISDGRSMPLF